MNRDPLCSQVSELLNAGIMITEERLDRCLLESQSTDDLIKELLLGVNGK